MSKDETASDDEGKCGVRILVDPPFSVLSKDVRSSGKNFAFTTRPSEIVQDGHQETGIPLEVLYG